MAVIDEKLVLANRKKQNVVDDMDRMGFDKQLPNTRKAYQMQEAAEDAEDVPNKATYDYLLKMPIDHLTVEKVEELQEQLEKQKEFVRDISTRKPEDMWREDLQALRVVIRYLIVICVECVSIKEYMKYLDTCLQHMDTIDGRPNQQPTRGRRGGRVSFCLIDTALRRQGL